jgi:hypothetical protein
MTPRQVTTVDLTELKEIELKCECGASIRLPLPLKSGNLLAWQDCPACPRKMWEKTDHPVRVRLERLIQAIDAWNGAGYKDLALRFVLTEPVEHKT